MCVVESQESKLSQSWLVTTVTWVQTWCWNQDLSWSLRTVLNETDIWNFDHHTPVCMCFCDTRLIENAEHFPSCGRLLFFLVMYLPVCRGAVRSEKKWKWDTLEFVEEWSENSFRGQLVLSFKNSYTFLVFLTSFVRTFSLNRKTERRGRKNRDIKRRGKKFGQVYRIEWHINISNID